jgi:uncharacterized protein YabN with tetrapyrrole methylase and pyrophosphatase domain|tara:strand:- start:2850 stop:3071 length:222 start_codon:yes stop_codon:yes gene_type:complete
MSIDEEYHSELKDQGYHECLDEVKALVEKMLEKVVSDPHTFMPIMYKVDKQWHDLKKSEDVLVALTSELEKLP